MADIRHLENRQISTDFDEIWYINADLEFGDSHVTKYENFSYSRWRAAAILKSFLAITQQPISVKFCIMGKQLFTEFR